MSEQARKRPCIQYTKPGCLRRDHVFACWNSKGKIPMNCLSPHKTMPDVCRSKGEETVYRSPAASQLMKRHITAQPAGFVDRPKKQVVVDTMEGVEQ